jgi:hypothetical protein
VTVDLLRQLPRRHLYLAGGLQGEHGHQGLALDLEGDEHPIGGHYDVLRFAGLLLRQENG